jgi:recombinational DNA repair protein RecT
MNAKPKYKPETPEEKARREENQAQDNKRSFDATVKKEDAIAAIHKFLLADGTISRILKIVGKDRQGTVEACISGVVSILQKSDRDKKSGVALWDCTPRSIANAIRDSIQHGIPIDGRGLAYLVREKFEARFTPGYKGYINRVCEFNSTADFQVGMVFEGEEFSVSRENGVDSYHHNVNTPFPQGVDYKARLIGAYCYLSYTKGGRYYAKLERISTEDINKIRSKARTDSVWNEWLSEQIIKTVVRRSTKIPFASVVASLDAIDNESYDLNQKPADQEKGKAWDDALKAEREAKEGKTVDGEATVVETNDIPSDGGDMSVSSTSNEEEKPGGMGEWSGQLAIPFMPAEEMQNLMTFDNAVEAGQELLNVLASTDSRKERTETIEANKELFGALLKSDKKEAIKIIEQAHAIECEAEHP